MKSIINLFLLFQVFNFNKAYTKCIPEEEVFSSHVSSSEEGKLACSNPKPGDLVDACNGEACGVITYDKAVRDAVLYEKPDLKSPIVGHVKRCEPLKDYKYFSEFKKYGELEALVDLPGYGLKKGDVIKYLWTDMGDYYGCLNGRPIIVTASYDRDISESCFFEKSDSKLEGWVRHRASNGKIGYSKESESSFFIPYGGWLESLMCPKDLEKMKKKERRNPPLPNPPIDTTKFEKTRTS